MANTYTLISSNVLTSSAASVTFSSIPGTYTDLVLRFSAKSTYSSDNFQSASYYLNNSTSSVYSRTRLTGDGSTPTSGVQSNLSDGRIQNPLGASFNDTYVFGSCEIYIPSYTASQNKPVSIFSVMDRNATLSYIVAEAQLWRDTSAISSIKLEPFGGAESFTSGSSFYLYGIKNS